MNKNGKTTDLNKLANLMNQGSNLLDSIPDIPTRKPEKTLTLGKGNGLLSGLLNADGNVSLPKAGGNDKRTLVADICNCWCNGCTNDLVITTQ